MDIKEAFNKMEKGHVFICDNDEFKYRLIDDELSYLNEFNNEWETCDILTNLMIQSNWTLVKRDTLSDKVKEFEIPIGTTSEYSYTEKDVKQFIKEILLLSEDVEINMAYQNNFIRKVQALSGDRFK